MSRPDLAALEAFAAVAREASFARAATALGLARSSLSTTIRLLEERLGVRLFNRTTRSVALTEAGERLLERLDPAMRELSAALDSVNAFRDTPAGRLGITLPMPVLPQLQPVINRFLLAHPAVTLELSMDGVLRDIVRERFDAGVRLGQRIAQDMIALPLAQPLNLVVVAAPALLARLPPIRTPRDLSPGTCLRIRFPSGALPPWRFRERGRDFEVEVSGPLVANDDLALAAAACDGLGLSYAVEERVRPMLADGRLVTLLESWMPPPERFYLYYAARRQVPAPLRAFIDFLRREGALAGR